MNLKSFDQRGIANPDRLSIVQVIGTSCLLLITLLFSGCASSYYRDTGNVSLGPTFMIFSPNGEPLNGGPLGRPKCEAALGRWLERVDINHDGRISHDEFMSDASAQFARMDIDRNGYLVPEELERYRLPYRQNSVPRTRGQSPSGEGAWDGQEQQPHRSHRRSTRVEERGGAGSSTQIGVVDPVMSADVNNDFKVTRQEYMAHSERILLAIDTNHDNFVGREEIIAPCIKTAGKL